MNKLHSFPQSVRVHRYKLDSRDCYQRGTPQPFISKLSQTETEIQNLQQPDEGYPSVDSTWHPPGLQTQTVNDSNMQEGIRERLTDSSFDY